MNLGTFFTLYIISIPIFIFFDLMWIGVVAKGFYQSHLGYLLGEVNWMAAVFFYVIFLAGLTFFATLPSLDGSLIRGILLGGFFGLVTYATYDLTNHATIQGWPLAITVVDMLWGAVLGAIVTTLARLVYTMLG